MNKYTVLLFFFIPLFCHGQYNDTIFYKNGDIETVYKIESILTDKILFSKNKRDVFLNMTEINNVRRITSKSQTIIYDFISAKNVLQTQLKTTGTTTLQTKDTLIFDSNILEKVHEIQIAPIQYSLNKFYKQKRVGHVFLGAGIISGAFYVLDPINNTSLGYIAGGLGLISFFIDIDSYKWIKRASLESSGKGITLKIDL